MVATAGGSFGEFADECAGVIGVGARRDGAAFAFGDSLDGSDGGEVTAVGIVLVVVLEWHAVDAIGGLATGHFDFASASVWGSAAEGLGLA